MSMTPKQTADLAGRVLDEIEKVVVGRRRPLELVFLGILGRGHVLLEDVPGLGKTMMARCFSEALGLSFNRVQFTPDLLPADLTGVSVFDQRSNAFAYHPGPVFTQLLLADEINRTPPKTQAALLQAMQEHQVTAAGKTYPLPDPFFVLATQNPIEQEGTYPLPEAQLDRFMFNVVIDYPDSADERRILAETTTSADRAAQHVTTGVQLEAARMLVRELPAAANVIDYSLRLIRATRPNDPTAPAPVKDWVRWGVGPRAGQSLLLGAKAFALLDGRPAPALDDVTRVALPVLRHRLLVNFQAEADGVSPDDVIGKLLATVKP
jgi:MoxR-like ATPase